MQTTRAPRFGRSSTSPSEASTLSASRKGVRLTPKAVHSSTSATRSPG